MYLHTTDATQRPRRASRAFLSTIALASITLASVGVAGAASAADVPTGTDTLAATFAQHGDGAPVMIAAHRGLWRIAPENSLPAIEGSIASGAEIVEIDVKRTKDGVLILMHDDSVNRTTNGTGNVSDLTFSQIQELRLREGLGGPSAAVTDVQIPTLEQALVATKDRTMINLDKGWDYREAMYDLAVKTGTLRTAIFKSSAPVAEVEAFRAKDANIVYSHVVDDGNAASLGEFGDHPPAAFELIFDRLTDAQIQPAAVAAAHTTSRIWINTMWKGLAADYTDEASLINPKNGWKPVIERFDGDTLQTDNVAELTRYLAGDDVTTVKDPSRSFRVQAEDYSLLGKGIGYFDIDDNNSGNAARPYEGVDLCNQQGAIVACYTRATEWMRYDIDVPTAGTYNIDGRIAVNAPTGSISLDYGNEVTSESVTIRNTTSHDAFEMQRIDTARELTSGAQSIWVRLGATGTQNYNLDYLQFDRTSADVPGVLTPAVPSITGTPQVGKTLTAISEGWGDGVALGYQWSANGTAVADATSPTFTVRAADRSATITVAVTGVKAGYTTLTVESPATAAVAAGVITTGTPTITGTPKVGKKLTAHAGTWTAGVTFSYRWYVNAKPVAGAVTSHYTVKRSNAGDRVTVRVAAKKTGYTTTAVTSKSVKIKK